MMINDCKLPTNLRFTTRFVKCNPLTKYVRKVVAHTIYDLNRNKVIPPSVSDLSNLLITSHVSIIHYLGPKLRSRWTEVSTTNIE